MSVASKLTDKIEVILFSATAIVITFAVTTCELQKPAPKCPEPPDLSKLKQDISNLIDKEIEK